jgi:hypothetical protein
MPKTPTSPKPAKPKKKAKKPAKPASAPSTSWVGRVPHIKPGQYADGLPIHQIEYLCCKLLLKPNRLTSRQSLFDFTNVLKAPARECGVTISVLTPDMAPLKIREVLFMDTPDFRFYNNAFILRRRIMYEDGFPVGEPEIVFKHRGNDIQKAAETDVRPQITGDHRVKFKAQALPLKERLGGIRMLYSHNVQFPRSSAGPEQVLTIEQLCKIFPVLETLKREPDEKLQLVSNTIIEEVLQDICVLDFGEGIKAKTNVAIWRTRGEHRPLIGEFAFQIRFKHRAQMDPEAMRRAEAFFIALQFAAKDWISLTATKTGSVYRLLGNPPKSDE